MPIKCSFTLNFCLILHFDRHFHWKPYNNEKDQQFLHRISFSVKLACITNFQIFCTLNIFSLVELIKFYDRRLYCFVHRFYIILLAVLGHKFWSYALRRLATKNIFKYFVMITFFKLLYPKKIFVLLCFLACRATLSTGVLWLLGFKRNYSYSICVLVKIYYIIALLQIL